MLPALLLLMAETPAAEALPNAWAHVSRIGALNRVREVVDIATGAARPGAPLPYRLRLTRQGHDGKVQTLWTDSDACPAVRPAIAAMTGITMPRPAPYGVPGEQDGFVLDGTTYTLHVPSSDPSGELTISSNIGTALAVWVDRSLKAWAPCWKAAP